MMRVVMQGDKTIEFTMDHDTSRRCGSCQLCCRLLPVAEIEKQANTRCVHLRHGKGCSVYHDPSRGFPASCGLWGCVWLQDPASPLRRPDHSHVVVDSLPDQIAISFNDEPMKMMGVVQVWVDPDYPDAHRDPGLRAYLAKMAEDHGIAALIRYNSDDAFVLFAPALSPTGDWFEHNSDMNL